MIVKKYVKRPIPVEAMQLPEPTDGQAVDEFFAWMQMAADASACDFIMRPEGHVEIHTLEGAMRADIGDWIIKGVQGELYPCKPDIFQASYTEAPA